MKNNLMNYELNIGKYIIDNLKNTGCFIVLFDKGIYYCTAWEVKGDVFKATVSGIDESGLPVVLNADVVANNPNLEIVDAPNGSTGATTNNLSLNNGILTSTVNGVPSSQDLSGLNPVELQNLSGTHIGTIGV